MAGIFAMCISSGVSNDADAVNLESPSSTTSDQARSPPWLAVFPRVVFNASPYLDGDLLILFLIEDEEA